MNQLRNLRFNALAILIVFAVFDLIIAFEAGRRFERKRVNAEPHVYFKASDMPRLFRPSLPERL